MLHLIESDDPLEAGLEIIASRRQEAADAVAALGRRAGPDRDGADLRVFLTNPSPICVLDEVDAPLDDHNVERTATSWTR